MKVLNALLRGPCWVAVAFYDNCLTLAAPKPGDEEAGVDLNRHRQHEPVLLCQPPIPDWDCLEEDDVNIPSGGLVG